MNCTVIVDEEATEEAEAQAGYYAQRAGTDGSVTMAPPR
jgi:hypothetical protein